jgi:GTPase
MAMLKHLSTRLIHSHTDLMRQKGGIGLRGPGETKLEADRITIRRRMKFLTEKLEKVRLQREQGRRARLKAAIPTVALVGYTNAGKSTLFNRLCSSEVYAANQLFATLDPTLRRIEMSDLGPVIFADTVGFIRHLPHDLVEAFRATLVEVTEADLLLHVIDVADPNRQANIDQVNEVLESIGASEVPQILVFNKIDLKNETLSQEPLLEDENHLRVWISAQTGFHLEDLEAAIRRVLGKDRKEYTLVLKPESARLRASLYEAKSVVSETIDSEGNWHLLVRLSLADYQRLF